MLNALGSFTVEGSFIALERPHKPGTYLHNVWKSADT